MRESFWSLEKALGPRFYVSNLKWLLLTLQGGLLLAKVSNWLRVLAHYILPFARSTQIRLRDGHTLDVPRRYLFESVAETILLDAYNFSASAVRGVVVDIGTSVGDFVLLASSQGVRKIHAFEPNPDLLGWLRLNVANNGLETVIVHGSAADGSTIALICENEAIDFLKIDCEGCEYEVILCSPPHAFKRVSRLAIETHTIPGHTPRELAAFIEKMGFSGAANYTRPGIIPIRFSHPGTTRLAPQGASLIWILDLWAVSRSMMISPWATLPNAAS